MAKRDSVEGLGEKLLAARTKAGLSQRQVEAASAVSSAMICQFEMGKKTPTLATLYKLADAYGIDVCELLPKKTKGEERTDCEPVPTAP